MKNLANCTTIEFLRQINRIKNKTAELYKVIDVAEIRKLAPKFNGDETPEEITRMRQRKGLENFSLILDKCLEENVELTVEVIGLMCFKTKEEAAEMDVNELFDNVFEIFGSKRCVDFFTKWAKPVLTDTAKLFYPSTSED